MCPVISATACSDVVRAYDAQGWHRTGTDVDAASAAWLVDELRARGVAGEAESFPFRRVDPDPCRVTDGDWEVAGYPLIDCLLPPPGVIVKGVLGGTPRRGHIALVRTDGHGRVSDIDSLRDEPWEAIIAAVDGAPGGPTLRNAWRYEAPAGPPVIQVPGEAWGRLEEARAGGAAISLACGAKQLDVTAFNVVATVRGRDPSLPPVAILTPRSGWWHCAGERGGGIAIWLEVAREVREAALARDVVFVATTGHELGFWGIRRHFERHPGAASAALSWVHLGANIGASGSPTVVRSSDEPLLQAARAADARLGGSAVLPEWELRAQPPGGEAQVVAAHGGTYLSLVGRGFSFFHSSEDRWPGAIDPTAIASNGRLVLEYVKQLEPPPA